MVAEKANFCCEYCLISQDDSYDCFQIDHIRNLKHGGLSELGNLALSCPDCNAHKGADIGTFLNGPDSFARFFNPREDDWQDHFEAFEGAIYPKTPIGEATIKILQLNDPDRIIEGVQLTVLFAFSHPLPLKGSLSEAAANSLKIKQIFHFFG